MNYICIDAGQTKTEIVVFDKDDQEIKRWKTSPIMHPAKKGGLDSYRNIVVSIEQHLGEMAIPGPVTMAFSLSGYHPGNQAITSAIKQELEQRNIMPNHLYIFPDYIGNWYSATKGIEGIIIISGGGTVAYGKNEKGQEYRMGGWGHLLGDEGSGYWIGLEAIKVMMKINNQIISQKSILCSVIEKALNISNEYDLLQLIYSEQIADSDIAKLVPLVNQCALQGDKVASEILTHAVEHLSQLCLSMLNKVGEVPVYLTGGVFNSEIIFNGVSDIIIKNGYTLPIQNKITDPIEGPLLLAKQEIQL